MMVHIVDHHPDKQVLATGKSGGSFPCLYSNNSTENHLNSLRFDSLEAARDAAFQLVSHLKYIRWPRSGSGVL